MKGYMEKLLTDKWFWFGCVLVWFALCSAALQYEQHKAKLHRRKLSIVDEHWRWI